MNVPFFGNSVRLARLYSNKTLNEVADALGVTRQYISRLETDKAIPSEEFSERLAGVLGVKKGFFLHYEPGQVGEHQFHFRKLRSTKVGTKNTTIAMAEIYRRLVGYLEGKLDFPELNIPSITASDPEDIENAAEQVRSEWGLGLGPIANMTRCLENAGVPVTFFKGISREVDALSVSSKRPVIVRNDYKESPGRLRFDLAHECGHLVMHEGRLTGCRATEGEANRFASAFLVPRSTFLAACPVMDRISWEKIKELKAYFKVSKACLLYRARQLDRITEQQYKNAIIRLKKHEGKQEFDDFLLGESEKPELVNNALKALWEHYGIGISQVEKELNLLPGMLINVLGCYEPPASHGNNVVSINKFAVGM
ncbi:helix-turn-helix domain-containing protein [Endozoicomonas lisbonensis]|uniref:Zn-dependent peptidase ImmA (M78 family)/transcriptional regulator with XRE-family HTH domain n=1 Tax=Endozoicomonas lisbonensis TaxID=3120522 RepID=A0ABV2SFI4_9GAMM